MSSATNSQALITPSGGNGDDGRDHHGDRGRGGRGGNGIRVCISHSISCMVNGIHIDFHGEETVQKSMPTLQQARPYHQRLHIPPRYCSYGKCLSL